MSIPRFPCALRRIYPAKPQLQAKPGFAFWARRIKRRSQRQSLEGFPVQSSNSEKLITVIGGSGFVGRHVVRSLAKRGYRVRVACRRPDLAGHVLPFGVPGQIALVQANVRYPASVAAACEGAYAVINLTATFQKGSAQSYQGVNVFGAEAVAKAAKAAKAQVFIHMSGLGADVPDSASAYVASRAEGEAKARAAFPGASVLQPSVIFGPEDDFFNRFAAMARFSPALPLIGGDTRFQPVFVGDVAEAAATLVDRGVADGKTYELGGPEVKTFREILQFVLATTCRKRLLLPIPFGAAKLLATVLGVLPKAPITADQVEVLKSDNVVSAKAQAEGRTLQAFGIAPRSYEAVVPSYLYRYRKAGQFTAPNAQT
ncbi:MAG: complex I NDUFA9 subunit family protein [Alphaproteobacteria bacterium]|nr:complex I NDUFA9 subunit family protein [Alphaproteobacteria bacterium]